MVLMMPKLVVGESKGDEEDGVAMKRHDSFLSLSQVEMENVGDDGGPIEERVTKGS